MRDRRFTYVIDAGYKAVKEPCLRYFLYDNVQDPLQLHPLEGASARSDEDGSRLEDLLISWIMHEEDGFIQHLKKEVANG